MVKGCATSFNVIESEKNTLFLYKFFSLNLNCMAKIKDRSLHLFSNLRHKIFISQWLRNFLMRSDICKSFVLGVGKQCFEGATYIVRQLLFDNQDLGFQNLTPSRLEIGTSVRHSSGRHSGGAVWVVNCWQ